MRGSSVTTKLLGKRPTVSYSGARGIGGSVMKRMFAVSAIGIGVFASQPALAETIYLACTLVSESDKNVTHFDVTLNEEAGTAGRSEEHTSELQSLMRISYAVFCLKKKNKHIQNH